MKILFLVQGEGRGHMTQAISLGQILRRAGHEVAAAMVGKAADRSIPAFFTEQILCPVYQFDAPNIAYKAGGGGMSLTKTLSRIITNLPKYVRGLLFIQKSFRDIKPDMIISFYETSGGLFNLLFRPNVPFVCIAHQYLLLHPKFIFPENSKVNRILINLNSKATSLLATKRLALSFRPIESESSLKVVPPLIRQEVQMLKPVAGNFFLVYLTHHSLSAQIIEWHNAHPEVELRCFWDNTNVAEILEYDSKLTFYRINSERYLHMLAHCKALVTTAGFESVCEAMYLGKPVMMVPVPNHFEQECNALDGVISGAGVTAKTFDLSVMLDYLPQHQNHSKKFKEWYQKGEKMFVEEIEILCPSILEHKKVLADQQ